jgi:opacity protein-like surface antigen
MKKLIAILFTLVLMLSGAYAHNGMEHVMGTVASISNNAITVTTADGKTQTVTTTADTKYMKMDAAIGLKDIKVGDRVVIHASKKDNTLIAAMVQVGIGKASGVNWAPRKKPGKLIPAVALG